jgi:FkbM family methyltransferase
VLEAAVNPLKNLASRLPLSWQTTLQRLHYRRKIRRGTFISQEPEFELLSTLVQPGDWVIDAGANVGTYTTRLAELVGPQGRVLAFEPMPQTFAHLASVVAYCGLANVSLFNVALSDHNCAGHALMVVPTWAQSTRLNYYEAHLVPADAGSLDRAQRVLTLSVDALPLPARIALVKIDVEGHEVAALRGMERLLARDHPTVIVEHPHAEAVALLFGLGYKSTQTPGSPNTVFQVEEKT